MSKITTARSAVADIKNNSVVASVGVIGWITPDAVLAALGERFKQSQLPENLTFYFPCGTGDAVYIKGMDHVAQEGLMKRIVSGSYINPRHPDTGERPALMGLIKNDLVEAYSWPIGASMQWLREVARKSPGYITEIGLDTYIDPIHGGGKFTERAQENLVERIEIAGKTFLFYPTWNIDCAIIHASSSDEDGNLSFETEALVSSAKALAIAAKACGGKVIAQVRNIVPKHSRTASVVELPGLFVDDVVLTPDAMMGTNTPYDETFFSGKKAELTQLPKPMMSIDKVIARRAALEVKKRELSIFGFGAAADVPLVMNEQGLFDDGAIDDYYFTTEHGSYGGVVMSGWQFSANKNPTSIIDGLMQFDVIDGGLCKFAALAFAEFDSKGTVNVSKFAGANPGAGGFIDIAQNAQRLVFTGSFTTGGLKTEIKDGALHIIQEGRFKKFCRQAESVTYRVIEGVIRGQTALIVTERAVFEVTSNGLKIIEIAPGIDFQKDIVEQMEFPLIETPNNIPLMSKMLFE